MTLLTVTCHSHEVSSLRLLYEYKMYRTERVLLFCVGLGAVSSTVYSVLVSEREREREREREMRTVT